MNKIEFENTDGVSDVLLTDTVMSYLCEGIDKNTIINGFMGEHKERVIDIISEVEELIKLKGTCPDNI